MIPFASSLMAQKGRDASLDDLFSGGETGDWWWFDTEFMDVKTFNQQIRNVVGQVNGLALTPLVDADNKRPNTRLSGGYQCAYFDGGVADTLQHVFGSTIPQPGTIILALTSSDTDTGAYVTGSSAAVRWQISNDSSDNIIAYSGATLDSAFNSPIGTKVLSAEYNGASSRFRRNGTTTATGNAGTQGTNRFLFGALWDETFPAEFYLFAALGISRILTASELDRAERILGSKGGITW